MLLKSIAESRQDKTINLEEVRDDQVMLKKNITCMDEKAVTTIDFCGAAGKALNPFDDQTPRQILTRQYKIYEQTIDPSWLGDQIEFPDILLKQPAIQRAIATFFYIRSDVELSIRINATPYHAGMMMVTWYPDGQPSDTDTNPMRHSGMSPVCLNYSTSDSVELKYHWVDPQSWVFINSGEEVNFSIGTLVLDPLVPVSNTTVSGGNENIYCTIYARFLEPRTAGFQPLPPPSEDNLVTLKKSIANIVKNKVAIEQSSMSGLFQALSPTPQPIDPEAKVKSDDSSQVAKAPRFSLAPIFKNIPLVGDIYSTVSSIVKTAADYMDKPRSLQFAHKMQMDWSTDLANGVGQDAAARMSLYPQSNLAVKGIFDKNCHTSQYSIAQLCGIPMLHQYYVFNNTNTSFQLGVHPRYTGSYNYITDNRVQPDYLMWISSSFRFWRGSIKYFFMFVTNGFTTARFRISYFVDPSTPAGYTAGGGDFPSVIVDVKGTTYKTLLIPYLFELPWRKVLPTERGADSEALVPGLRIEQLVAPTASAGDSMITCVVWRAGGEDYQLMQLQNNSMQTVASGPALVAEEQTSLHGIFSKPFDTMGCDSCGSVESGFSSSEGTGPLIDCLRRYCTDSSYEWNSDHSGFALKIVLDTRGDESWREPLYALLAIFKYWRGSLRFKKALPTQEEDRFTMNGDNGTSGTEGNGYAWTMGPHQPLQIEIPYYSTVPWQITGVNNSYLNYTSATSNQGGTTTSTTGALNCSVGDDFLAAVLFTPPVVETTTGRRKDTKN